MIILCTAILTWVMFKCGVIWEGYGPAAWVFAAAADTALFAFLIYRLTI